MSNRLDNDGVCKLKVAALKYQTLKAIERYSRHKKRTAFIKRNLKAITSLSMDGWPRTRNMKDYPKWLELIYKAKIAGVYGFGTANCDVIAQLNRFANQLKKRHELRK